MSTRTFGAVLGALSLALALGACEAPTPDAGTETDTMAAAPGPEGGAASPAPDTARLIDPNQAAETELRAAGLDSATVAGLVAGRPFASMTDVDEALAVRMDSAARANLYRRVFIPIDLNSAVREEILLIPGVGPRMAHEFEEYRPYRGMAQFRREIGKYVDEREVARLERYVTIR